MIEQSLGKVLLPRTYLEPTFRNHRRQTKWLEIVGIKVNAHSISEDCVNYLKQVKQSLNCDILNAEIELFSDYNETWLTATYADETLLMLDKLRIVNFNDYAVREYFKFFDQLCHSS